MSDNTSIFNPEALLDTSYSEGPADHYTPVPEGEYLLTVKDIIIREQTSQEGRKFYPADVQMIVEDDGVKAAMNMQEPTCRMTVFLDIDPGTNKLLFGTNQNVRLGMLKKACGLRDGRNWSLRHLIGQSCYGKIRNEADRNDPERIFSRVVSVTREPTAKAEGRAGSRQAAE